MARTRTACGNNPFRIGPIHSSSHWCSRMFGYHLCRPSLKQSCRPAQRSRIDHNDYSPHVDNTRNFLYRALNIQEGQAMKTDNHARHLRKRRNHRTQRIHVAHAQHLCRWVALQNLVVHESTAPVCAARYPNRPHHAPPPVAPVDSRAGKAKLTAPFAVAANSSETRSGATASVAHAMASPVVSAVCTLVSITWAEHKRLARPSCAT